MAKIREEHYVTLRGGKDAKRYPTYPGVLIAAHESGLIALETEMLQAPSEENGWMAIVRATATIRTADGLEMTFSDLGDCSPKNSTAQIAVAALRMASTRAKGRALRDAIALGETLLEELPDEVEEKPAGKQKAAGPVGDSHNLGIKHGPACAMCGLVLDPNTYQASVKRFSQPLCVQHGKERMEALRAEAEAETSGYMQEESAA